MNKNHRKVNYKAEKKNPPFGFESIPAIAENDRPYAISTDEHLDIVKKAQEVIHRNKMYGQEYDKEIIADISVGAILCQIVLHCKKYVVKEDIHDNSFYQKDGYETWIEGEILVLSMDKDMFGQPAKDMVTIQGNEIPVAFMGKIEAEYRKDTETTLCQLCLLLDDKIIEDIALYKKAKEKEITWAKIQLVA